MQRRYEVFLSSTSRDLEDTREILADFIANNGHIPIAMNLFERSFRPPWETIVRYIDDSDYFVLISGTDYGSSAPGHDESYTEREFSYALLKGKTIVVFLIADACLEKTTPAATAIEQKLLRFRERLKKGHLVIWEDKATLARQYSHLLTVMNQHPAEGGWVRASEAEKEIHDLRMQIETAREEEAALQRRCDVYAYVLNRLNPYENLTITIEFLRTLVASRFDRIDDVLYPLQVLLKHYVKYQIAPGMRVYFAYRLAEEELVSATAGGASKGGLYGLYRLGISVSDEEGWYEGLLLSRNSNVHRVYERQRTGAIENACRSFHSAESANERVEDEGSVLGVPILFADDLGTQLASMGVVGLSSPKIGEATSDRYQALARELTTLFSALFYVYGRRYLASLSFDAAVERLRHEIIDHYKQ